MRQRPDPAVLEAQRRILGRIRELSGINPEIEPRDYAAAEETLRDLLMELSDDHREAALMILRGQVLARRQPLELVEILGKAVWTIANEEQNTNLFRLAGFLKKSTCAIFRGVLSGGEIFLRNKNDGNTQYYTFAPLPERIRRELRIGFSISRTNAQKILNAYDKLVDESKGNDWMASQWTVQKEMFINFMKIFAPRLLEPAPAN